MSIEDIDKQIQELQAKRAIELKSEKKEKIAEIKEIILAFNITIGDLRGEVRKKLLGNKFSIQPVKKA
jgi:hypothetical protein